MNLLHVGDLHLRDGAHLDDVVACLDHVITVVEDHDIDAILIPGDIFEAKSSPAERDAFRGWLERLRCRFEGPVVICKGNHDVPRDLLVWDIAEGVYVFEQPEMLTLQKAGPGDTSILAQDAGDGYPPLGELLDLLVVPWPEKAHLAARGFAGEGGDQAGGAALGDMIRLMAATRDDTSRPLVIMGHLSVTGAMTSSGQPLIGREIQASSGDLVDTRACYVALNHIHKHQELAPNVVYAGSLSRHDFGEQDEPKGVVVVSIEATRLEHRVNWEFVPTPARPWHTIEAEVAGGQVFEHIEPQPYEDLTRPVPLELIDHACIRYRYACTAEEQHLFDHAEIERRFAAAHTLKIVPVVERTERVRAAEVAAAPTVREKVLAWGKATGTTIPDTALDKLEDLQAAAR